MNYKKIRFLKYFILGLWMLISNNLVFAQGTVSVNIPSNLTGQIGVSQWIDVTVGATTSLNNVKLWGFDLSYDPAVLTINDVSIDGTVTPTGGFFTKNLTYAANKVRVGWIRTSPMVTAGGTLVRVQVTPLATGFSDLRFNGTFAFNSDATVTPSISDLGKITIGAVSVSVGAQVGVLKAGDPVSISINTAAIPASSNVKQFQFNFTYDPTVFQFNTTDIAGTFGAGGLATVSSSGSTRLVGWVRATALTEGSAGTLIKLTGTVLKKTATPSDITLSNFVYGTGTPTVSTSNGTIVVSNTAPTLTTSPVGGLTQLENSAFTYTLTGGDADAQDVSTLAYSFTSTPAIPASALVGNAFSWTPGFASSGVYTVTFTVTDASAAVASVARTITVNNNNRTPVLALTPSTLAYTKNEGETLTIQLTGTDADVGVDGDAITYSMVSTCLLYTSPSPRDS